ncbi:MAG: hypothetical protein AAB605_03690, partial [Patescibacteria group bacterium]
AMNPGALKCFREFFEMAEQAGFQPCISAALRTPAHQRSSCLGSSGTVCGRGKGSGPKGCPTNLPGYLGCPHVKGYGIDINDKSGKLNALLAYARQSGKFSMVGVPGTNDIWHIEAANCGNPNFNPNPSLQDNWSGATSPTSSLFNSLRQALGMSTQQPVATQPAFSSQPVSTSQSPIQAFQEPQTASPGVSSQIDITSGGTTHATSAADLLEELAFGPKKPAPVTVTGTTVPLVVSGSDAIGISGTQQTSGQQNLPPGVSGIPEQTFISGDLSWQGGAIQPTQPLTGWEAIIATIKAVLNRMLQLLVPFGARDTIYLNESGEFEEVE